MGRQRAPRRTPDPAVDDGPVVSPFEFIADDHGGVTVMRDGHPQSHVRLDDPTAIEFEYVQHFALVVDVLNPRAPAPLGVTHVGGAGLTLARYVEATRPGSPQIVLEPDAALTDAVRRELPLPRGHRIRVRAADGASGMKQLKDASADLIVLDAFADGRVPAELVAPAFVGDVTRVLAPGGVLLANLANEPGLAWAARAIATVREHLPHVAVLAAQEVLKGKRYGNVVVAAAVSSTAIDEAGIARAAARAIFPTGVRRGRDLDALLRGAAAFTDADVHRSPAPPELGAWRVR